MKSELPQAFFIPANRLSSGEWAAIAVMGGMTFISAFHLSGVAALLPSIASTLGLNGGRASWITGSYLFSVAALLLVFGRAGDRFGLLRFYKTGLFVFATMSLLCAVGFEPRAFLVCRLVQGAGMAMLSATSPAILAGAIRPRFRGLAFGLQATMTSIGVVAGPSLSGILAARFSWAAWFILVGSITVIMIPLTFSVFRDSPSKPSIPAPFDRIGAVAWTLGVGCLLLILALATPPLNHPVALRFSAVVFALCIAVVIARELFARAPFLRFASLRESKTLVCALAEMLNYVCLYGVGFLAPLEFIRVKGLTPAASGLALTLAAAPRIAVSPLGGYISDRFPEFPSTAFATAVMTLGIIAFGFACETASLFVIGAALMTVHVALGLFGPANLKNALATIPKEKRGAAASLVATARSLGMAIGASGAGIAYGLIIARENKTDPSNAVGLCSVPIAIVGIVSCICLSRRSSRELPVLRFADASE